MKRELAVKIAKYLQFGALDVEDIPKICDLPEYIKKPLVEAAVIPKDFFQLITTTNKVVPASGLKPLRSAATCRYLLKSGVFDSLVDRLVACNYEEEVPEEEPCEEVWFSGPATIVKWPDGEKTVVKCNKEDTFDPVKGYLVAYFLKTSGMTRTQAGKWFDEMRESYEDSTV